MPESNGPLEWNGNPTPPRSPAEADAAMDPASVDMAPSLLPDLLPMVRHLDPAASLAYRTPLLEHIQSADGKAVGLLTLLGLMFTVLAKFGPTLSALLQSGTPLRFVCGGLVLAFAGAALGTVIQAFRTIAPRFPKSPPSLAFFGDIARLSREEYLARVRALDPDAALVQMLIYNHTNSVIVVSKFRQFVLGLRFFRVAFLSWTVLVSIVAYRVLSA